MRVCVPRRAPLQVKSPRRVFLPASNGLWFSSSTSTSTSSSSFLTHQNEQNKLIYVLPSLLRKEITLFQIPRLNTASTLSWNEQALLHFSLLFHSLCVLPQHSNSRLSKRERIMINKFIVIVDIVKWISNCLCVATHDCWQILKERSVFNKKFRKIFS